MTAQAWQDLDAMSRDEVMAIASQAVLIHPIGSTEQHGPELPLGTDAWTATAALHAALRLGKCAAPIVVAPTLPFGASDHHLFAAASSLRSSTLALVLADLVRSGFRSGFRRILFVNGHGGNEPAGLMAVNDAALEYEVLVGFVSYWSLVEAQDGPLDAHLVPGHAGAFEASLLLSSRAEHFDGKALRSVEPAGEPMVVSQMVQHRATCIRNGDWQRVGGFTDDPSLGSSQAGERYFQALAPRLHSLINDFAALTPPADTPERSAS